MKRIVSIVLVMGMIFVLTACGTNNQSNNNQESKKDTATVEEKKGNPIDELNEDEKRVYDTILAHKDEWVSPSSVKVMEVKDYCYKPDADPSKELNSDLIVAKIEGENKVGGTITQWYIFSLSDRSSFRADNHPYTSSYTEAAMLCYKGSKGDCAEIEDIDDFYDFTDLITFGYDISEKKINEALSYHWDQAY